MLPSSGLQKHLQEIWKTEEKESHDLWAATMERFLGTVNVELTIVLD
jgi:hypothetical protein